MILSKQRLSGSADGRMIKVVGTIAGGVATATTIHTAKAGTAVNDTYDEIWLWAMNSNAANRQLDMLFGGTLGDDQQITWLPPVGAGLILIAPGLPLQNGDIVKALADVANVVMIAGYVNTISP